MPSREGTISKDSERISQPARAAFLLSATSGILFGENGNKDWLLGERRRRSSSYVVRVATRTSQQVVAS
jgi:hypothetical protein